MDYQEFRDKMDALDAFIETCETKEIDGDIHITINDDNVDEFREIMQDLITIATSDDNYVDQILEYLAEIDQKITDKNMIAKFIPVFAAIQAFASAVRTFAQGEVEEGKAIELFKGTGDPNVDEWVFEMNTLTAPMDARFGKVVDKVKTESGSTVIKIKAPLANEIVEWEDTMFVVVPEMEKILKEYQTKYTKTFF